MENHKPMKTEKLLLFTLILTIFSCSPGKKEEQSEEATTNEKSLVGEEVTYQTDSTTMKGYIAYDENMEGTAPGIIVIHEWWGHNDYVRQRADMLAELGYVALAVDMYGEGKQADHPKDASKFSGMVMGNLDVAKARFDQALATLKSNEKVNPDQIAAIGYCFGGSVALTMANAGYDLDAVAAFHSGLQLPIMPQEGIKAKILVCNGADDPFIPAEQVAAFTAAMDSAKAEYEYIAYDSAVHAFTSPAATEMGNKFDLPLAYNAEADSASWEEMKELFSEVF